MIEYVELEVKRNLVNAEFAISTAELDDEEVKKQEILKAKNIAFTDVLFKQYKGAKHSELNELHRAARLAVEHEFPNIQGFLDALKLLGEDNYTNHELYEDLNATVVDRKIPSKVKEWSKELEEFNKQKRAYALEINNDSHLYELSVYAREVI